MRDIGIENFQLNTPKARTSFGRWEVNDYELEAIVSNFIRSWTVHHPDIMISRIRLQHSWRALCNLQNLYIYIYIERLHSFTILHAHLCQLALEQLHNTSLVTRVHPNTSNHRHGFSPNWPDHLHNCGASSTSSSGPNQWKGWEGSVGA